MADVISPTLEQGSVMQPEPTSSSPAVAAPAKPDYHSVVSERNYPQWDKQEGWLHKLLGRGPGSHTPGLEKKFPASSGSFHGVDAKVGEVGSNPLDEADPPIDTDRANPVVSTIEPPILVNGVAFPDGVDHAETPAVGGEIVKPTGDQAERIKMNTERLSASNAAGSLRDLIRRRIRAALLAAAVLGGAAGLIPPMRVEAPRTEQPVAPLPPISEQERILGEVLRGNMEMKNLGEAGHSAKGMFENDSVRAMAEKLAGGDVELKQYLEQAAHDSHDPRYGDFSAAVATVRGDELFGTNLEQYRKIIAEVNKSQEVLASDNDTLQVDKFFALTSGGVGKLWEVSRAQQTQSQGTGMQP